MNDTFSTARYAADTPHKEYLATRCRDAWLKWETSLQDISLEVAGDSPPPMIFREFAQVKLHEGRFENHLSQFANYLKTGTVPEPLDPIDDALIRLCQHQPINQDKLLTQLNEVEKLVSSLKGIPFAHDLHALKTNLMQPTPVRRYRITNTDHWELLLYSGTDVRSCQSLDTAGFNRGLLGTLLDGSCRMVAIIDPVSRKIVARSMIRLLIHEATQQPVIFQEPLYPQPCRANLASALNQFTLTVAQEMGLPLYREDRSITDDSVLNTLIHQGGSLLQYTDAGGGLVKGRFFIPQAIEVIPK